jgi:hypothetical protein
VVPIMKIGAVRFRIRLWDADKHEKDQNTWQTITQWRGASFKD